MNVSDPTNVKSMKESIYYFREWILNHKDKVLPENNIILELGTIEDSPKTIIY
jgi:hypothetical protein